jgi:rod shape-determining protein MreC
MYQLLKLIHSYRAFLVFLFIEFVCFWLLVRSNPYHSAAYFHTSSSIIGSIYQTRTNITQYFNLPAVNEELANDNAQLRELISQSQVPIVVNSSTDSIKLSKAEYNYGFLSAKVINNSTQLSHNFITINKGSVNGVQPGMGVISANGVVGKVMSVSDHFAAVSSLLNNDVYVSAVVKRTGNFGSAHWDTKDPLITKLMFVPSHIQLQQGDTVMTSGYNSIFPENIMIGFIEKFSLQTDSFYDIDVKLSNDFSRLSYVYVVRNPRREERINLENEKIGEVE